jgi:hypothetical protein
MGRMRAPCQRDLDRHVPADRDKDRCQYSLC